MCSSDAGFPVSMVYGVRFAGFADVGRTWWMLAAWTKDSHWYSVPSFRAARIALLLSEIVLINRSHFPFRQSDLLDDIVCLVPYFL